MAADSQRGDAFRRFEQTAHDRVAESYRDFFAPVTDHAVDALLRAAGIPSGSCVLDVAAGIGTAAVRAAERGASRVVAVDLAAGMIALASSRYRSIEFYQADAEALPFRDDTFDAVICNFGLGHFPSPEATIAEVVRVLRPGRRAALSWWVLPGGARLNGLFLEAAARAGVEPPADLPQGPAVTRFSDELELRALLEAAGMIGPVVTEERWSVQVSSTDEWWNGGLRSLVRASATILAQAPAVQREIRSVFDALAETYRVGDGFTVPMAAKIVAGEKR